MKKILTIILVFALFGCKSSQFAQVSFDALGKITEGKLKELLKAESWQFKKDSLTVSVVVPRTHTQKVLGKKMSAWFTKEGQASLTKKDLHLSLEWKPKDSTQVQITLKRYRYGISTNF